VIGALMATVTRVLGQASGPDGTLATVEADYEDATPFRLLALRCVNQTAGNVAVVATQVSNGRTGSRTFPPGTSTLSLPTGVATRLVLSAAGLRRGQLDGVAVDVRVPA
jgi:hypothetical protein